MEIVAVKMGMPYYEDLEKGKVEDSENNSNKAFILFVESQYDGQVVGRTVTFFTDKEKAQEAFGKAKETALKIAKTNEWEIGHDDDSYFEAYPSGSYPESHESVELVEVVEGVAKYLHG